MSRIVVGLSGGVDSAVAAWLLKKEGHEVIGCRMRTFDTEESVIEEESAKAVAEHLQIPLIIKDYREEFKKCVIDYFAEEYAAGRTPNPCLICNRKVKWQSLLTCMNDEGAEYVATGHYAAVEYEGRWCVRRVGNAKDQSYALFNLTQEELSHTVFPLSKFTKDEIRLMAEEAGLSNSKKPDSMEICFIPENDYAGFLRDRFNIADCPGNYVDVNGNVLGRHEGIIHYTVGQRKGLGIALGKRIFVKEIRPLTNEVVLADDEDVFTGSLRLRDVNFQLAPEEKEEITARLIKVRYADHGMPGRMYRDEKNGGYIVEFEKPVRAAAPGQAAVLYDEEDRILCGGFIE
ncbi:MAG: tRNA 2-thiouridine(34) synthase MnmA [Lachnospiraceae bacterium]|nr:tRNA 2-thiouridine(34) synthase MnmA [Lachnospiraceae bacterium]